MLWFYIAYVYLHAQYMDLNQKKKSLKIEEKKIENVSKAGGEGGGEGEGKEQDVGQASLKGLRPSLLPTLVYVMAQT